MEIRYKVQASPQKEDILHIEQGRLAVKLGNTKSTKTNLTQLLQANSKVNINRLHVGKLNQLFLHHFGIIYCSITNGLHCPPPLLHIILPEKMHACHAPSLCLSLKDTLSQ